MKPFHKLTDSEKYKLEKTGLLWELYPEADLYKPMPEAEKRMRPLDALQAFEVIVENFNPFFQKVEEPDNPEMIAFLKEVENYHYPREQFQADICAIANSWDKKRQNDKITREFQDLRFKENL